MYILPTIRDLLSITKCTLPTIRDLHCIPKCSLPTIRDLLYTVLQTAHCQVPTISVVVREAGLEPGLLPQTTVYMLP